MAIRPYSVPYSMDRAQIGNETPQVDQVDVPPGIRNFLQKRNRTPFQAVRGRYFVSDVVGCQRKIYYSQLGFEMEELLADTILENTWDSVRGDFLHKGITCASRWRELDIEYHVPLRDGRTAIAVGRLDMYDWRTRTIIDLKTTKFVKWQIKHGFLPKVEHILQVQCYGTIFSQRLPIENLNILYADMNDFITYKIPRRNLTKWIESKIQETEDSIYDKRVPKGEVSGLCKYCRYQTRCYQDGNGLTEKPQSVGGVAI